MNITVAVLCYLISSAALYHAVNRSYGLTVYVFWIVLGLLTAHLALVEPIPVIAGLLLYAMAAVTEGLWRRK